MRDIKFKVLDAETNELIGYERVDCRGQWEHKRERRKEWLLGSITDGQGSREFIRLLFTGLKDKNGIEIYKGDIVLYYEGTKAEVIFKDAQFIGYDKYASLSDEKYLLLTNFDDTFDKDTDFTIEIIGNIHQHPELLNTKDQ